jgi:hypothetical protein
MEKDSCSASGTSGPLNLEPVFGEAGAPNGREAVRLPVIDDSCYRLVAGVGGVCLPCCSANCPVEKVDLYLSEKLVLEKEGARGSHC